MQLPPSADPLHALPTDRLPTATLLWLHDTLGTRGDAHSRSAFPPASASAVRSPSAVRSDPVSAYVYDLDVAAGNAARLKAALPSWAAVFYAVKANGYPPVLDALAAGHTIGAGHAVGTGHAVATGQGVDGFEVASVHEITLALDTARRAGRRARIVASGPGKSTPVLAALVETAGTAGSEVTVNVESPGELRRLNHVAGRARRRIPVTLRVNPSRVALAGSVRMGGVASAFGIPEADVPDVLDIARSLLWVDVVGFHVHAVSGNLDTTAHLDYVRWCLGYSVSTAAMHGVDLRIVNVGGGLGVAFEPDRRGERPFDLDAFAAGLRATPVPAGVQVLFEPGRWLVADCGAYAAEVTDVKHSHGTDFVVLRGGIHHFQLPTSWEIVHNFGVVGVDAWPYDFPRPGVVGRPVTVVGELCTPEDTLARDITVDAIRAGDMVVFPMAGAYGYEFAMQGFLGHPPPARVAISQGPGGGFTHVHTSSTHTSSTHTSSTHTSSTHTGSTHTSSTHTGSSHTTSTRSTQ
ncbi:type III PLP-dependent enzyme [Protofrankia symbiont of Coriaria ruscifolia]|uniref:type III PLP-dependent enzyme n=1 Tax=Protofrankia symbiont of Coriaria ruscifolia TaxID=1306542 RepID=UPI001041317F|nr:type III PLP-dependent enzyme [Protofrankia symbiont of Coriaria ruscifolia]